MQKRRFRFFVIPSLLLIVVAGVGILMILAVHAFADAMGGGCGGG